MFAIDLHQLESCLAKELGCDLWRLIEEVPLLVPVHKHAKVVVKELLDRNLGILARQLRFGVVCRHHKTAADTLQDL